MPRRQFVADLKQSQQDPLPRGLHDLKAGEDDGQFEFLYRSLSEEAGNASVQITALIPELSDYPSAHEYLIFCADDAPQHLAKQLQNLRKTERTTVAQLLELVSDSLCESENSQVENPETQGISQQAMDYDDEDDDDDDFFGDSYNKPQHTISKASGDVKRTTEPTTNTTWQSRNRIRSDLRAVKDAGFHVDVLGDVLQGERAYISISIRTSKLGISQEAIQAWKLNPQEYIILLIHYPSGYKTNEQLQNLENIRLRLNYSVRIFSSQYTKPSLQEAIQAFTKAAKDYNGDYPTTRQTQPSSLKEIFISRPLMSLLDERLPAILKGRSAGMEWSGAESWYQDLQNASTDTELAIPDKYFEPEKHLSSLPDIVNADQYANRDLPHHSFPLLAMQFMLRHMVRCVEFCLVCHRKIDSEIEAIKPYVCSQPLCLFQYMNMGFGPSIEHEILSQPWVVDLLVSFCYSSAASNKLQDLPTGLGMRVPGAPSPSKPVTQALMGYIRDTALTPVDEFAHSEEYAVGFDADNREVIFHDKPAQGCPVGRGSWIVIQSEAGADGMAKELHCRVTETSFYPTIKVAEPVLVRDTVVALPNSMLIRKAPTNTPATPAPSPRYTPASFRAYDQDFDQLGHTQKCQTICKLLDLLPSVSEMQTYLDKSRTSDLTKWVDRIPLATLSLLRWIIASNRACIMQVDGSTASSSSSYASSEERLYGMSGYIQFRFAMGAPDKEERFLSAVRRTKQRLKLKYPTIFAWHGSPLHNWHMIIREGLHFKNADHGRAYGHGVYHAVNASISVGYSHMSGVKWPGSILKVSSAIALNELVNAPAEYVSSSPYYVVSQLDWIQTRYLLVKCDPTDESMKAGAETQPELVHEQDPSRTPTGTSGSIVIPASAMRSSHSKIGSTNNTNTVAKKLKNLFGNAVAVSSGTDSETEDDDQDHDTMFVDEEPPITSANSQVLPYVSGKASKKTDKKKDTEIDFVPGSLDWSTLPLMPMPTYANPGTTKRLMSELKSVNKTMAETPQEELGWYVDVEKIENVYQWIVELHSFHNFMSKGKPIPLAKDMQDAKIKSIVLEVRFGSDFPFSPPYIRVVRPRFLTFAQGGGGHVVMGGAMCMELLTNTGWSSISSIESVLMQVRLAIASEPFARLEKGVRADYGNAEAADGFIRACRTHGWTIPPGFKELSYGAPSSY